MQQRCLEINARVWKVAAALTGGHFFALGGGSGGGGLLHSDQLAEAALALLGGPPSSAPLPAGEEAVSRAGERASGGSGDPLGPLEVGLKLVQEASKGKGGGGALGAARVTALKQLCGECKRFSIMTCVRSKRNKAALRFE
jgi:hypothetical protein